MRTNYKLKFLLLIYFLLFAFTSNIYAQEFSNDGGGGWPFRRQIKITNSTGTVNNAIIPVSLSTSSFDYEKFQPGGYDVRFSGEDGNELDFYKSFWNPSSVSKFCVKFNTLTESTTYFYIHFGNIHAENSSQKASGFFEWNFSFEGDDPGPVTDDLNNWTFDQPGSSDNVEFRIFDTVYKEGRRSLYTASDGAGDEESGYYKRLQTMEFPHLTGSGKPYNHWVSFYVYIKERPIPESPRPLFYLRSNLPAIQTGIGNTNFLFYDPNISTYHDISTFREGPEHETGRWHEVSLLINPGTGYKFFADGISNGNFYKYNRMDKNLSRIRVILPDYDVSGSVYFDNIHGYRDYSVGDFIVIDTGSTEDDEVPSGVIDNTAKINLTIPEHTRDFVTDNNYYMTAGEVDRRFVTDSSIKAALGAFENTARAGRNIKSFEEMLLLITLRDYIHRPVTIYRELKLKFTEISELIEGTNIAPENLAVVHFTDTGVYSLLENYSVNPAGDYLEFEADEFSYFLPTGYYASGETMSEITNRPNPFNPNIEDTLVEYTLEQDTEVTLRIFSITGEYIYSESFNAGENGGKHGLNEFTWDGKNKRGMTVANGTYLLYIETGRGHSRKRLISVVK